MRIKSAQRLRRPFAGTSQNARSAAQGEKERASEARREEPTNCAPVAAPGAKEGKLSGLDAAAKVLSEAGRSAFMLAQ